LHAVTVLALALSELSTGVGFSPEPAEKSTYHSLAAEPDKAFGVRSVEVVCGGEGVPQKGGGVQKRGG